MKVTNRGTWIELETAGGREAFALDTARELRDQLAAALGPDDITKALYDACLGFIDWTIILTDGRCICGACDAKAERIDLIRHDDGCPVGAAWAAMIQYKSVEQPAKVEQKGVGG